MEKEDLIHQTQEMHKDTRDKVKLLTLMSYGLNLLCFTSGQGMELAQLLINGPKANAILSNDIK